MMHTAQLNKRLHCALIEVFGDVGVHNVGNPGAFSLPPSNGSMLRKHKHRDKKYAHVEDWGETYSVRCPVCDDHKQRLYISYFTGKIIEKSGTAWQFGMVGTCHNEKCHIREELLEIVRISEDYTDVEVEEVTLKAAVTYKTFVKTNVSLPKAFPLYASNVPPHVLQYLWDRGYDPSELAKNHEIRYMPADTLLWTKEDGEEVKSFEDRILIPVIQGLCVTGWQARVVDKNYTGKCKYLFPSTQGLHGKSTWIYNMDKAKFHQDMVICEGVTDVWKIGPQAVCTFGKSLSERQMYIMQMLWEYKGSCVICADFDAIAQWEKNADILRKRKIFPKGVAVIPFPEGYDAADYDPETLTTMIAQWRATCHNNVK